LWQVSLHGLVFCLLLVVPWVAAAAVFRDWWPPPAATKPVAAPSSASAAVAPVPRCLGHKLHGSSSYLLDPSPGGSGYSSGSSSGGLAVIKASSSVAAASSPQAAYSKGRKGRTVVRKPLHFFEPFGVFADAYHILTDVPLYRRPDVQALLLLVPYWFLLLTLSKQLPLDAAAASGASAAAIASSSSGGGVGIRAAVAWAAKAAAKASLWPLRALWSTAAMRHAVQRLAVGGCALAAVLSGVGCVGLPCDYLFGRAALLAPLRHRAAAAATTAAGGSRGSSGDGGELGPAARLLAERTTAELTACGARLAAKTRALLVERRRLARARHWAHERDGGAASGGGGGSGREARLLAHAAAAAPPTQLTALQETQRVRWWWWWWGGSDGDSVCGSSGGLPSGAAVAALREEVETLRAMSQARCTARRTPSLLLLPLLPLF
jgi:hypothetical protein